MTYGVIPSGFSRKPLAVILAEIENQLITEFGPDVVQTAQSPLGQLNGLFSDIVSELWEIAEDVYQSYDPNQAEGTRLDMLGAIRNMHRTVGEQDSSYRQGIINSNTARVAWQDFIRAIRALDGVRYAQLFVNEEATFNEDGLAPNSIGLAVLGGDDIEVMTTAYPYITLGINTHGNVKINLNIMGYCRSLWLIRPNEVETRLTVRLTITQTRRNCPSPSATAIASSLLVYLRDPNTRALNGQNLDPYFLRSFIESNYEGVQFVSVYGFKGQEEFQYNGLIPFNFYEIADVTDVIVELI